jgi:hypothetical protein
MEEVGQQRDFWLALLPYLSLKSSTSGTRHLEKRGQVQRRRSQYHQDTEKVAWRGRPGV